MELTVYNEENYSLIYLEGTLDSHSAQHLLNWFQDQTFQTSFHYLVDLSKTDYISSVGIATILEISELSNRKMAKVIYFNPNEEIELLFQLFYLHEKIYICKDRDTITKKFHI